MEHKEALPANTDASPPDILGMAKSHCKPRIRLSSLVKARKENNQQASPAPAADVNCNAMKLVMITVAAPFQSTSSYYDLMGLNYREGNDAKKGAVDKKLLTEHRFHSGRHGGQSVLLEPSKTAYALFKLPFPYENPGFIHRYLQHQVKAVMTDRGYKAVLEKNVKGKNIDVVLEKGKEKVAVEIAVTDKHEVVNVRKDIFQAKISRIIVICKDRKVASAVEKKLASAFDHEVLSKVTCCLLADLIEGVDGEAK